MPIRRIPAPVAQQPQTQPPPQVASSAEPRVIVPPASSASPPQSEAGTDPAPRARRRGHATKDDKGKWQPAGDYQTGFAKPPLHTRFDGTKPGPGRPKGARSQDSIIRDELNQVRTITVNGVQTQFKQRELAVKLYVKQALEKQQVKALAHVIEMGRQHFPEQRTEDLAGSASANAFDHDLLAQLFAGLGLGEAIPGANPMQDALVSRPAEPASEASWEGEDWEEPGAPLEEGEADD